MPSRKVKILDRDNKLPISIKQSHVEYKKNKYTTKLLNFYVTIDHRFLVWVILQAYLTFHYNLVGWDNILTIQDTTDNIHYPSSVTRHDFINILYYMCMQNENSTYKYKNYTAPCYKNYSNLFISLNVDSSYKKICVRQHSTWSSTF